MKGLDGVLEFLLGAVFGADRVLLVEFPQVKQVVGAVAHVVLFLALVGRRNPDGCNAYFLQMGGVFLQLVPELPVVGQVPLKILHHDSVFHFVRFLVNVVRVVPPSGGRLMGKTVPWRLPGGAPDDDFTRSRQQNRVLKARRVRHTAGVMSRKMSGRTCGKLEKRAFRQGRTEPAREPSGVKLALVAAGKTSVSERVWKERARPLSACSFRSRRGLRRSLEGFHASAVLWSR